MHGNPVASPALDAGSVTLGHRLAASVWTSWVAGEAVITLVDRSEQALPDRAQHSGELSGRRADYAVLHGGAARSRPRR